MGTKTSCRPYAISPPQANVAEPIDPVDLLGGWMWRQRAGGGRLATRLLRCGGRHHSPGVPAAGPHGDNPILVKQRAVNLVYAHTLGGSPPMSLVSELQDLATRAQNSYARMIRQTRGS